MSTKKTGRPKKQAEAVKAGYIEVRCEEAEKQAFRAAAEAVVRVGWVAGAGLVWSSARAGSGKSAMTQITAEAADNGRCFRMRLDTVSFPHT
jgi:hypothetical protein